MAPGALRSEPPATYSLPLKQSSQGPTANKHEFVNDGIDDYSSNGHKSHTQNGRDIVTSEFLLEQSQKIASGNGHGPSKKPNIHSMCCRACAAGEGAIPARGPPEVVGAGDRVERTQR